MKLIDLSTYSYLRDELNEYVILCNQYRYQPTPEDFDDCVKFLLLYQSGTSTLTESNLASKLYEEFSSSITETSYDPEKDWDAVTGLVGGVAKGAAALLAGGVALSVLGAYKVGDWIKHLWKKGKVIKAVKAEIDAEMKKIDDYAELNKLLSKRAELEGEVDWKSELPSISRI
jgi:hypothetical protein